MFVLHEEASLPLSSAPVLDCDEIVLVIGPEGGVADDELELFRDAGATAARLGENVLRTSTAGVAALSVLQTRLGRW
jgi:16S rRNA (uracil1498-N3)-methyltransferase